DVAQVLLGERTVVPEGLAHRGRGFLRHARLVQRREERIAGREAEEREAQRDDDANDGNRLRESGEEDAQHAREILSSRGERRAAGAARDPRTIRTSCATSRRDANRESSGGGARRP